MATRPLTVTRPSRIRSSTFLRAATPARARIFCNLSAVTIPPTSSDSSISADGPESIDVLASVSSPTAPEALRGRGDAGRFSRVAKLGSLAGIDAESLLELLERRQLRQALQAEMHQEFARRRIEKGPADDLFSAGDPQQALLEQLRMTAWDCLPRISCTSGAVTGWR